MKTTSNISNKIMRRIYMSYALSYAEQPLLWCGLALGGAVALLGRFTHVASVIENTWATPFTQMPTYMTNSFLSAVARGELGTVLVILAIASLSSVAIWQLSRLRLFHRFHWA